ncbi:MazG-like family protein [Paenibacillus zanthoxyli]|nr:MazG-like family protein [Paenibacillus zanthoxyli]
MADELADVLVYAVYLAQSLDLNMEDVILAKLKKNAKYAAIRNETS